MQVLSYISSYSHLRLETFSALKIKHMLRPVKDQLQRIEIPCECGKVYIGQTGCMVSERISEHERDLRMQYFDKSAVAQHALEKQPSYHF